MGARSGQTRSTFGQTPPSNAGTLGDYLQRHALERTASLVPRHRWVPWVVVNGIPLFDDFENVATFICAAYGGYPK